jgi:hypothetical protein
MCRLTCAGCGGSIDPDSEPFYEFYIGKKKLLAHARSDETYVNVDELECLKEAAGVEEAEILVKGRSYHEDPVMFRRVNTLNGSELIEIIGNTKDDLLRVLDANKITPEEIRLQRMDASCGR